MNETSLSLLARLRDGDDTETWNRFAELYLPLIKAWAGRYDVQASDADDLAQETVAAVVADLKRFEHSGRPGAFRSWLRAILVNRLRNFWRARSRRPLAEGHPEIQRRLDELEDPASQLSQRWNREHDLHVAGRLLKMAEPHFAPNTWRAFCRVALDGARADVVADELGISANAVFIAKSRVLRRLRQEAEGLLELGADFLARS